MNQSADDWSTKRTGPRGTDAGRASQNLESGRYNLWTIGSHSCACTTVEQEPNWDRANSKTNIQSPANETTLGAKKCDQHRYSQQSKCRCPCRFSALSSEHRCRFKKQGKSPIEAIRPLTLNIVFALRQIAAIFGSGLDRKFDDRELKIIWFLKGPIAPTRAREISHLQPPIP